MHSGVVEGEGGGWRWEILNPIRRHAGIAGREVGRVDLPESDGLTFGPIGKFEFVL